MFNYFEPDLHRNGLHAVHVNDLEQIRELATGTLPKKICHLLDEVPGYCIADTLKVQTEIASLKVQLRPLWQGSPYGGGFDRNFNVKFFQGFGGDVDRDDEAESSKADLVH